MAYQGETPSSAIVAAPSAVHRRKRLILLFSERSRPIACSVETALLERGWDVSIEFGDHARPWIQRGPPTAPSLRILCVAGRVNPAYARQLRLALSPDAHADLHILGLDDSRSVVHDIERLAGVRQPSRRSLYARPRLHHSTQAETTVERERHWLLGTTAALASFAITLGGIAMAHVGPAAPTQPATSIAAIPTPVYTALDAAPPSREPRTDTPVLSAVSPHSFPEPDGWIPEEEDDDLIILDDKPPAEAILRVIEVAAPPLVDPAIEVKPDERPQLVAPSPVAAPPDDSLADLMPGNAPLPSSEVPPIAPRVQLPPGFLPVAGLSVASGEEPLEERQPSPPRARLGSTTADEPFVDLTAAPRARATVDPFAELPPPAEPPPPGS